MQRKQETKNTIMKAIIYIIVQSAITENGEFKNILGTFALKHQAENRFNEIVVEFVNKQDEQGNFLWKCELAFLNVATFKSNTHNKSFRMEIVEREIEI